MKSFRLSTSIPLLMIVSIFLLFACGGSDSSTSGSKVTASTAESGTVALFMKDGPLDDYDEIWITVTKVALIPVQGDGDDDRDDDFEENAYKSMDDEEDDDRDEWDGNDHVVIFESEEGEEVDLLRFRDEPYLFLVDGDVPAGEYAKIRMWIKDIQPVGDGVCAEIEVKLPSGRIDLNPQGGFTVVPGETLAIELDVDLEKSISMHPAGKSGKCIFRPVIFVDIYDSPSLMPKCPRTISGAIVAFIEDDDGAIVGFEMKLANGGKDKKPIKVLIENAAIFDENGFFVGPEALAIGDEVKVRGKLNEKGAVDARMVVVGDVAMVKGVVLDAVDEATGIFNLKPEPGQVVTGETLPVYVASETLVLIGCDAETKPSAIQEGMEAVVIGKIDIDDGVLLAVAVLLRPEKLTGLLTEVVPVAQGNWLTVVTNPEASQPTELVLFLPGSVLPHIKGDGLIPTDLVVSLVDCKGRPVEIVVDTEDKYTVSELALIPEQVSGTVLADADPEDSWLSLYDRTLGQTFVIQVYEYPTILDAEGSLIDLETIKVGDFVVSHGFESCEAGIDQEAFILSVKAGANIVETLKADGDFTTLVAALEATGLDDALAGDGPFTVFAPTDEAFDDLPEGLLDELLADTDALTKVLTYHVYAGFLLAADVIALDGKTVDMLNGLGMTIDVVGGDVVLNLGKDAEATVIITDVLCSNGVIHVIDAVLDTADAP